MSSATFIRVIRVSCHSSCLLILKINGDITPIVMIGTFAWANWFGYIPVYKAVFSNNRYLEYFKEFEKENRAWHRKWARITTAFCIGES